MSVHCCNYQRIATEEEKANALALERCEYCSRTTEELVALGRTLEICGIEHGSNLGSSERVLIAIPICSACHEEHHLGADLRTDPCAVSAQRSWEALPDSRPRSATLPLVGTVFR